MSEERDKSIPESGNHADASKIAEHEEPISKFMSDESMEFREDGEVEDGEIDDDVGETGKMSDNDEPDLKDQKDFKDKEISNNGAPKGKHHKHHENRHHSHRRRPHEGSVAHERVCSRSRSPARRHHSKRGRGKKAKNVRPQSRCKKPGYYNDKDEIEGDLMMGIYPNPSCARDLNENRSPIFYGSDVDKGSGSRESEGSAVSGSCKKGRRLKDYFSGDEEIDIHVASHEKEEIFRSRNHPIEVRERQKRERLRRLKRSKEFYQRKNKKKNDKYMEKKKPVERQPCKFHMNGRCGKTNCQYSHDFEPPKKQELCKFYAISSCLKGDSCIYLHSQFPCKFYNTGNKYCAQGDNCKFSHDPLTQETRSLLDRFSEEKPFVLDGEEDMEPEEKPRKCSLLGSPPKPLSFGSMIKQPEEDVQSQREAHGMKSLLELNVSVPAQTHKRPSPPAQRFMGPSLLGVMPIQFLSQPPPLLSEINPNFKFDYDHQPANSSRPPMGPGPRMMNFQQPRHPGGMQTRPPPSNNGPPYRMRGGHPQGNQRPNGPPPYMRSGGLVNRPPVMMGMQQRPPPFGGPGMPPRMCGPQMGMRQRMPPQHVQHRHPPPHSFQQQHQQEQNHQDYYNDQLDKIAQLVMTGREAAEKLQNENKQLKETMGDDEMEDFMAPLRPLESAMNSRPNEMLVKNEVNANAALNQVPPGAYVPGNQDAILPAVRLGSPTTTSNTDLTSMHPKQLELYQKLAFIDDNAEPQQGTPTTSANSVLVNMLNIATSSGTSQPQPTTASASNEFVWRLIPLELSVKIPYPLMNLPTDLPYLLNDPRLRGHRTKSDIKSPVTTPVVPDALLIKPPPLNDLTPEPNDTDTGTSSPQVKAELMSLLNLDIPFQPPAHKPFKLQLNELANTYVEDNNGGSVSKQEPTRHDRSYLIDPRFRRRKANTSGVSPTPEAISVEDQSLESGSTES